MLSVFHPKCPRSNFGGERKKREREKKEREAVHTDSNRRFHSLDGQRANNIFLVWLVRHCTTTSLAALANGPWRHERNDGCSVNQRTGRSPLFMAAAPRLDFMPFPWSGIGMSKLSALPWLLLVSSNSVFPDKKPKKKNIRSLQKITLRPDLEIAAASLVICLKQAGKARSYSALARAAKTNRPSKRNRGNQGRRLTSLGVVDNNTPKNTKPGHIHFSPCSSPRADREECWCTAGPVLHQVTAASSRRSLCPGVSPTISSKLSEPLHLYSPSFATCQIRCPSLIWGRTIDNHKTPPFSASCPLLAIAPLSASPA